MNGRFFIDTNVFVYSLERGHSPKKLRAIQLIENAIRTGKGLISYQVVQEFFNVAFRRFTPKMTFSDAEQYLAITFHPLLKAQSSYQLYTEALVLSRRHSLSWYDSLILASALESECRVLYTEDLQDGQIFSDLKIENPFRAI